MRQRLTRLLTSASLAAAIVALIPAGPAAQNQGPTPEAMQRAQGAYQADLTRAAIARDKAAVVTGLMDRWHENIGDNERGRSLQGVFMNADPEKLLLMTQAKTWDELVAIQLGLNPDATFGSAANDLVFTPLTPCRVMDSRFGTGVFAGPFTSGQTISIFVADSLISGGRNQGGASACGFPFGIGAAAALNITVVPISGSGDLKIFPYAGPSPNASIINFYAGLNLANSTSAGIALANSSNDLSITVEFAASVHIIVDILGYYSSPVAAPLQRTIVQSAATTIANGGFYNPLDTPACPSGYSMVGGGFNEGLQFSGLWVWQNGPGDATGTFWRFRGYNATGGNTTVTVYGICAKTPGR